MVADQLAIVYSESLTLATFQTIKIKKAVKFITDFTTATDITGAIAGSCIGTCYLGLGSTSLSVTISANGRDYPISI